MTAGTGVMTLGNKILPEDKNLFSISCFQFHEPLLPLV